MNEQNYKQSVEMALEAYAAQAIPDDRDLWPTIAERLRRQGHARQHSLIPGAQWRWRLSRLSLLAGATILVATLLWAGFPPSSPRNVSAQEVLNNLAEVAAVVQLMPQQPVDLTGVVSTYRYIRSEGAHLVMIQGEGDRPLVALVPMSRQMWVAPDGSGRIRESWGEPIFLAEGDQANWEAAGSPPFSSAINEDFGPGGLHYENFADLPTDPDALAAIVQARAKLSDVPVNFGMLVAIGDLLREPGAPPELRSALYKVAARIEGIELLGKMSDRVGRPGVAIAMTARYTGGAKERLTLIFDPATAALLAEEKVLLEHARWTEAEPPVVISYNTYLESGVVTRLP